MPALEIMQENEFVYYQSNERGLRVQLGEGKKVQFTQEPERPWLLQIRINRKEDGKLIPIDEKWELANLLEKTKGFEKGEIRYVPSPDEVRAHVKIEDQDKACEDLKQALADGLYVLPLKEMKQDSLMILAEKIGAKKYAKNGKSLVGLMLRNAIAGKLGITNEFNSNPDQAKQAEEVVEEKTAPKPEQKTKKIRGK